MLCKYVVLFNVSASSGEGTLTPTEVNRAVHFSTLKWGVKVGVVVVEEGAVLSKSVACRTLGWVCIGFLDVME